MWAYPEIRFVGEMLTRRARSTPDRLALTYQNTDYDYATTDILTNKIACKLRAWGAGTDHRVLFLGKNSADFFLALLGTAKSGACFVPLNWRLAVRELAVIVGNAEASFAIVEREYETMWHEIRHLLEADIGHVIIDETNSLIAWSADQSGEPPKLHMREDDPVLLLYTSGTTGIPKGVIHTHASFNHSRLSEHFEPAFDWRDGDIFINTLPNFHLLSLALSLQCLYNGVAIGIIRQFTPQSLLEGITALRPTLLILTPTMIQLMLDDPAAATTDFSSLRLTMYAGSPIALGLIKRAISLMPCQFMQFYGQTETSGPVSLLRPDEHDLGNEETLKSCGRPLPLIRLRIVDAAGADLPDNTPGELLVGAPACSAGYWRRSAETEAAFKDGWYHTGDIAFRDDAGLFYIYDRAKDMIVSGGENIYAAEIENVLSLHPSVAAVAVIGVPHPQWGEAVKAVIVPRAEMPVTEHDLLTFCRAHLAGYKIPKSVDMIGDLPMTGSGKVAKNQLRAPYWSGHQRSVA